MTASRATAPPQVLVNDDGRSVGRDVADWLARLAPGAAGSTLSLAAGYLVSTAC